MKRRDFSQHQSARKFLVAFLRQHPALITSELCTCALNVSKIAVSEIIIQVPKIRLPQREPKSSSRNVSIGLRSMATINS